MAYPFNEIEKKWQTYWKENQTFKAEFPSNKPKYYVLDMFPYPSGAGLHVGHPLGYIASDIYTRYKRLKGFNVLHPMGYDAFGLPAEQYAIQTGQHPAKTTEVNAKRYREQLDAIGLSFDWSREVFTCAPDYYKHTQQTFIDLFNHWYDTATQKARPVAELIQYFEKNGNENLTAHTDQEEIFTADTWKGFSEKEKRNILLNYRLAYQADLMVNWCPALGTVLANDEVKEGLSVRGGHPVEQKSMQQWCLRITAYAQRLLDGLETIDWPLPLKEMQKNWIGKSIGAEIDFKIENSDDAFRIFTTRPDTLYGVTFMVLAPESDWVSKLTTGEQKTQVDEYLAYTKKRSERERVAETKNVSGVFTGSYAIHPLTDEKIPIWISEYVLAGYGTGAIMAVPAHDSRDHAFAKHFNLPIIPVIDSGEVLDYQESSYDIKDGKMINSELINGLNVKEAIKKIINAVADKKIGKPKTNYKLRDATFSRQRYWGEPFPIYYKDGMAYPVDSKDLPVELPEVDQYLPTETGEPPLGRAKDWKYKNEYQYELSTMPGFAGSSAYFLRYMDPHNDNELVSKEANQYWENVDFYVGGSEHATGHLLYSRFWNMFLFDTGKVCESEPFKKLINQGMIQGRSNYVYRVKGTNKFVSYDLKKDYETTQIHVDISIVQNDFLDVDKFKAWREEYKDAEFILNNGKYLCGVGVEKMSKSMYNVVNPDDIIAQYGADTFRLYEMFLGPVEQSKPWNTQGIEGVSRFMNKFYRLYYNENDQLEIEDTAPNDDEQKIIHQLIKKVSQDLESFSLNTSVSAFMICANDLAKLKCRKKEVLEKFVICLSPFAPHLCEQIWKDLGHSTSISFAIFPEYEDKYLVENTYKYPVSVNGKMKFLVDFPIDATKDELEKLIMEHADTQKLLEGKTLKKMIIVPKKIINFVV